MSSYPLLFHRKALNPGPSISEVKTAKPGMDFAFECHAVPSTSRSLPSRSCKTAIAHYDDNSSSSDDGIYDYPEHDFLESEQSNLNEESTKNSDKNKVIDNIEEDNVEEVATIIAPEDNSDEDSDPYGYRAELLGIGHTITSDDDY